MLFKVFSCFWLWVGREQEIENCIELHWLHVLRLSCYYFFLLRGQILLHQEFGLALAHCKFNSVKEITCQFGFHLQHFFSFESIYVEKLYCLFYLLLAGVQNNKCLFDHVVLADVVQSNVETYLRTDVLFNEVGLRQSNGVQRLFLLAQRLSLRLHGLQSFFKESHDVLGSHAYVVWL